MVHSLLTIQLDRLFLLIIILNDVINPNVRTFKTIPDNLSMKGGTNGKKETVF